MPAPTALQRAPEQLAEREAEMLDAPVEADTGTLIDAAIITPQTASTPPQAFTDDADNQQDEEMYVDTEGRPKFTAAANTSPEGAFRRQTRKILIPPHRIAPLRRSWSKICPPLVDVLKLQVRMNLKSKAVELRTSKFAGADASASLQRGEDFIKALALGFDVDDAIALLRVDELFIESFEVKDVKSLNGDHLSRAIGRIAGKDGKTKFAIENASRTRIVLANSTVHILGGFQNIHIAREAVVSLILGSKPSKVYGNLQTVAGRMKERF